jgi:hypothetical protein
MDMNKWFYRAVGAVGVAGGVMLLGSGVAHAETVSEAQPTADLQAMRGLVADLFSPTGGLHNLGLSIDMPDTRLNAGLVADGPLSITRGTGDLGVTAYAPGVQDISLTGKAPALTRALPNTGLLNSTGLLNGSTKEEALPGLDSVTGMLSGGPLGGLLGAQPGGSPPAASPTDRSAASPAASWAAPTAAAPWAACSAGTAARWAASPAASPAATARSAGSPAAWAT